MTTALINAQSLVVSSSRQKIELRQYSDRQAFTVVTPSADQNIRTVLTGPRGPRGFDGTGGEGGTELDLTTVNEAIDTKIGTHNQATPIHTTATSGRDFAASFQTGLI